MMLQRSMTMTAIAEIIGVSKSAVSREVKRNPDGRGKHVYRLEPGYPVLLCDALLLLGKRR